ncbi:MAG: DUF502 domain-containing protein [Planctomycetes bacterium]|nr:DUF502 domain-containing protein [Planctomycetota bacterium]MCB9868229.1 DUF502 domain-containing protein [Planctomycetota bacterium]MCB9888795.1 DUF502 domain-containing protein [Planctomycetota bacterium]
MRRHLTRCLVAGVVALLPIGGTVLTFLYIEHELAASWLREQKYYFPGMGVLLVLVLLYLVGLLVTTFLGRWMWRLVDRGLDRLPLLGAIYRTLKQILGYDSGGDALFHGVALVPSTDTGGVQIGLVTRRDADRWTVFLPGAPNPSNGRLVMLEPSQVTMVDSEVADALKALVSVGKADLRGEPDS